MSRFRSQLIKVSAFDQLLESINLQMEGYGVVVKSGISVDASITDTLRKPRGRITYEIAQDRQEDPLSKEQTDSNNRMI